MVTMQPKHLCILLQNAYIHVSVGDGITVNVHAYRTAPYIRLLDSLKANGSAGSAMRSQSFAMSAVIMDLFGNFLKTDFEPRVAANLHNASLDFL